MVIGLVAGAVVLLLAAAVTLRRRQSAVGILCRLALAVTVVLAVLLAPGTASDAGWFAAVLLGVPVVLALAPVLARGARPVTTAGAVVMLGWGLLLGLGLGLWFVLPALLLGVAAAAGTGRTAARA